MEFSFEEIIHSLSIPVWIVLIILLIMCLWCIYVAIERLITLGKGRAQSRELAAAIGGPLGRGDAGAALSLVGKAEFKQSYLGHMLGAGLKEYNARPDRAGLDAARRALERTAILEGAELRKGMNILATTGSSAPFVGLVGTIFGIISAFQGMAESGSGGLGAVSAGIAEALVMTAVGIIVAIIGVWLFNYFTARVEAISNDMAIISQEFIDWCEKQLLPPMNSADAAK